MVGVSGELKGGEREGREGRERRAWRRRRWHWLGIGRDGIEVEGCMDYLSPRWASLGQRGESWAQEVEARAGAPRVSHVEPRFALPLSLVNMSCLEPGGSRTEFCIPENHQAWDWKQRLGPSSREP